MLKSFSVALLIALFGVSFFLIYKAYDAVEETRADLQLMQTAVAKLQHETEAIAERLTAQNENARQGAELGFAPGSTPAAAGSPAGARTSHGKKSSVSSAPGSADPAPDADSDDPFSEAAMAGETQAAAEGTEAGSVAIQDQVKEALVALQDEQAKERQERRRERRVERIKERVDEYSERLNLQPAQEETLIVALSDHWEKREQIITQIRDSELDMADARPLLEEQRTAVETEIKTILSSSQYEEFKKLQEEEPGFGMLSGGNNRWGGNWGRGAQQTPPTDGQPGQTDTDAAPRR